MRMPVLDEDNSESSTVFFDVGVDELEEKEEEEEEEEKEKEANDAKDGDDLRLDVTGLGMTGFHEHERVPLNDEASHIALSSPTYTSATARNKDTDKPANGPAGSIPSSKRSDNEVSFVDKSLFLDGVEWGTDDVLNRNFDESFTQALRAVDLDGRSKLLIRQRFLRMARDFINRRRKTSRVYKISKSVISVGSLLVPVMLLLDSDFTQRSTTSQVFYYIALLASFTVSAVHSLNEVFKVQARYTAETVASEQLQSEGYDFLNLGGKYSTCPKHRNAWRKFLQNVEEIHDRYVSTTLNILSSKQEAVDISGLRTLNNPKDQRIRDWMQNAEAAQEALQS